MKSYKILGGYFLLLTFWQNNRNIFNFISKVNNSILVKVNQFTVWRMINFDSIEYTKIMSMWRMLNITLIKLILIKNTRLWRMININLILVNSSM